MKKLVVGIAMIAMAGAVSAALVMDEGFDYTLGDLDGQGGWTYDQYNRQLDVTAGTLDYSDTSGNALETSGKKVTIQQGNMTSRIYTQDFTDIVLSSNSVESVYYSFLLNVRSTGEGANKFSINLNNDKKIGEIQTLDDSTPGIKGWYNQWVPIQETADLALSDGVHLIVAQFSNRDLAGTAAHYVSTRIWVDPTDLGSATPNGTYGEMEHSRAVGDVTVQSISIANKDWGAYADMDIDEVRVGATWAEVTPFVGSGDPNDTDADGLPDAWELTYYVDITVADGATPCANGLNTANDAYISGISPVDADAFFTLSNAGNVLQWSAVSGRVYNVYSTTSLDDAFQNIEMGWTSGVYTDSAANGKSFYQIEVEMEP